MNQKMLAALISFDPVFTDGFTWLGEGVFGVILGGCSFVWNVSLLGEGVMIWVGLGWIFLKKQTMVEAQDTFWI